MPKDLVINNGKLDTSKLIGAPNVRDINYILNADAEVDLSGWVTYADAAQALPVDGVGGSPQANLWIRSTTTPLRGTGSFRLDKTGSATRQGQGVAYAFSIDKSDQAKVLSISFDYEVVSGTYASGDVTVYIYDVTNAQVIQPAGFQVENVSSGIQNKVIATFQTASNSTSYRLLLHIATASTQNYTLALDNVTVGPQSVQYGAPVTDWESYTPTVTTSTGSVTNATHQGFYRRVGANLEGRIRTTFSAASAAFSNVFYSIPAGLSVDTAKMLTSASGTAQTVGEATIYDTGVLNYSSLVRWTSGAGNRVELRFRQVSGTSVVEQGSTQASPFTIGANDEIYAEFTLPIAGWSSSLQLSDSTDTRVVSAKLTRGGTNQTGVNPNNTRVKINLTTAEHDTHGMFNSANNSLKIVVPGYYSIDAFILVNATNTLNQLYFASIFLNGSEAAIGSYITGLTGTLSVGLQVSCRRLLSAGDEIDLRLYGAGNNSVNTLTVNGGVNTTYLEAHRLSGPSVIAATETVAAHYYSTTNQTVNTSTYTKLNLTLKEFDTHSAFQTANNRYICPVSGFYSVTGHAQFAASGTTGLREIALYKNGTLFKSMGNTWTSTNNSGGTQGTTLIECQAGDFLEIFIWQNSAATLSTSSGQSRTWASFERIK